MSYEDFTIRINKKDLTPKCRDKYIWNIKVEEDENDSDTIIVDFDIDIGDYIEDDLENIKHEYDLIDSDELDNMVDIDSLDDRVEISEDVLPNILNKISSETDLYILGKNLSDYQKEIIRKIIS